MSINTLHGVLQGPFGSLVRERDGINDSNREELFSPRGQDALTRALTAYRDAGATIGGAPTYRLTHLRPLSTSPDQWESGSNGVAQLDRSHAEWNRAAVRIAKTVYGKKGFIFGLLAPIADTSGAHDGPWRDLGARQKEFVLRRHVPQIEVLRDAGIDHFLVEAGRYVQEAEALASLLAEDGAKTFGFSFEAPKGVIPDPAFSKLTFHQCADRVHEASRGRIATLIGINCVDAAAVRHALDRDDLPSIVYPNQPQNRTTPPEEYQKLFRDCLQAKAKIIGICCGGTPEHVSIARQEYETLGRSS